MRTPSFSRILAVLCFCLSSFGVFAQCKNIEAEATVVQGQEPGSRGISIEIKNARSNELTISLFGPDKKNQLNANKTLFDNLAPGKYLIVIVGKREEDNYCPKSISITVN